MASAAFPSPGPVNPIRGAIRISVATSTDSLVAGQEFSIFVTVQNPFEIPLILHRISAHLPTEFVDINELERAQQLVTIDNQLIEVDEAARRMGLPSSGLVRRRRTFFENLARVLSSVEILGLSFKLRDSAASGAVVARDLAEPSTQIQAAIRLPLVGNVAELRTRSTKQEPDPEVLKALRDRLQHQNSELLKARDMLERHPTITTKMQAGNSTTRVFTLRSRRKVSFRPATYRLQIQVEYEIGELFNVDTIDHSLQVKASLLSMVLGSLIGGLAGWFTSTGATIALDPKNAISLLVTLVFAMMAVVLFARKKDVQPLIAIEDFWGGIAIGFLVAYSGPHVIGNLFSSTGVSGSAPK